MKKLAKIVRGAPALLRALLGNTKKPERTVFKVTPLGKKYNPAKVFRVERLKSKNI